MFPTGDAPTYIPGEGFFKCRALGISRTYPSSSPAVNSFFFFFFQISPHSAVNEIWKILLIIYCVLFNIPCTSFGLYTVRGSLLRALIIPIEKKSYNPI